MRFFHPLSSKRTFTSGHTVVGHNGRNAYSSQRYISGKLHPKGRIATRPLHSMLYQLLLLLEQLTQVPISVDLGWPNSSQTIEKGSKVEFSSDTEATLSSPQRPQVGVSIKRFLEACWGKHLGAKKTGVCITEQIVT